MATTTIVCHVCGSWRCPEWRLAVMSRLYKACFYLPVRPQESDPRKESRSPI